MFSPLRSLPPLMFLALALAGSGARAASSDWATAVVVTEATGLDEPTVERLSRATLEACGGTSLQVQRSVEEFEVLLRRSGLNPRACATDVACIKDLGTTASVRYVVAVGAARIGDEVAITVDIVDTTWERKVGHGERNLSGAADWSELMSEVVTQALPVNMRKATGTLRVTSNVFGAAVLLDGRRIGVTPLEPVAVGPGQHVVKVIHPDFPEFRERIDLEPGESARVDARLVQPPPPPPVKPFFNNRRIGAIASGGGAAAFLAMGIGFGLSASASESEYFRVCAEHSGEPCRPDQTLPRGETQQMKSLRSDVGTKSALATVGYVGAGLGLVGAAVLITLDMLDSAEAAPETAPDAPRISAGLQLLPSAGTLVLSGSF